MQTNADNIDIARCSAISYKSGMKKTERLTIRVTDHTKQKIEELAARDDRSVNYYINKVLEKHIATHQPEKSGKQ